MLTDTLQHIDPVIVRPDVMQLTGDDRALGNADLFGARFGPGE